jgi:hypothetical protein
MSTVYGTGNSTADPVLVGSYFNGARDGSANPMQVAIAADEGGNAVDLRFGPLTIADSLPALAEYHLSSTSPAVVHTGVSAGAPNHDFDDDPRLAKIDIGADQYYSATAPKTLISPTSLSFGNQSLNTTSATQQITVTNTGITNLVFSSFTFNGTNSNQFALASTGNTCAAGGSGLAPNASCVLGVTFQPTSIGAKTANFALADTAGGVVATQTVTLTGTGSQAVVGFNWANGRRVGAWGRQSGTRTVTVTNTGTAALTMTAAPAVSNTLGNQFAIAGGNCSSTTLLDPAGSCTVVISRTRPSSAPFAGTGTLTITDTGAAATIQTVALIGR